MSADAYFDLLERGPFPGQIDPWAEDDFYFHQLHGTLITVLIDKIRRSLLERGYTPSREASLQIVENRKPDISVVHREQTPPETASLDYASAAIAVMASPGLAVQDIQEPDLDAIFIRDMELNVLVTVVEIISPRNKDHLDEILQYRNRRQTLYLQQNVNVVEIDMTRSSRRLYEHLLTTNNAYHTAVFLPGGELRIIPQEFGTPLPRLALPLRNEVIPVELQPAYDVACQQVAIAPQILKDRHYDASYLPFPSLLTDEQRQEALAAVDAWKNELNTLKPGS